MTKYKAIQILYSYLRAGAAAAVALYLAGETDPQTLCWAFVAAIAGPALKALDKTAKEFGRGSKK